MVIPFDFLWITRSKNIQIKKWWEVNRSCKGVSQNRDANTKKKYIYIYDGFLVGLRNKTCLENAKIIKWSICILSVLFYFLAVLGVHCFAWVFSSYCDQSLPLESAWASHCGDFPCCRVWALCMRASVVAMCGLNCSSACGILPDQGLNPCPLPWQADS